MKCWISISFLLFYFWFFLTRLSFWNLRVKFWRVAILVLAISNCLILWLLRWLWKSSVFIIEMLSLVFPSYQRGFLNVSRSKTWVNNLLLAVICNMMWHALSICCMRLFFGGFFWVPTLEIVMFWAVPVVSGPTKRCIDFASYCRPCCGATLTRWLLLRGYFVHDLSTGALSFASWLTLYMMLFVMYFVWWVWFPDDTIVCNFSHPWDLAMAVWLFVMILEASNRLLATLLLCHSLICGWWVYVKEL